MKYTNRSPPAIADTPCWWPHFLKPSAPTPITPLPPSAPSRRVVNRQREEGRSLFREFDPQRNCTGEARPLRGCSLEKIWGRKFQIAGRRECDLAVDFPDFPKPTRVHRADFDQIHHMID